MFFGRNRRKATEHTINSVRPLLGIFQHFNGTPANFWRDEFVLGFIGFMVTFHLNHTSGRQLSKEDKVRSLCDVFTALSNMNGTVIAQQFLKLTEANPPNLDFMRGDENALICASATYGKMPENGQPYYDLAKKMAASQGKPNDPSSIIAAMFQILFFEPLRKKFSENEKQDPELSKSPTVEAEVANIIALAEVQKISKDLGYRITEYGATIASLAIESGLSTAETALHLALLTIARDAKNANASQMVSMAEDGFETLKVIRNLKDQGLIRQEIWENDTKAIGKIIFPSAETEQWINKIQGSTDGGKEAVAVRIATGR